MINGAYLSCPADGTPLHGEDVVSDGRLECPRCDNRYRIEKVTA